MLLFSAPGNRTGAKLNKKTGGWMTSERATSLVQIWISWHLKSVNRREIQAFAWRSFDVTKNTDNCIIMWLSGWCMNWLKRLTGNTMSGREIMRYIKRPTRRRKELGSWSKSLTWPKDWCLLPSAGVSK